MAKRGPKTDTGKALVRLNAVRHGILSTTPVIPGLERAEEWELHRAGLLASLAPEGALETALAERVALELWRLQRVPRYEREVIAVAMALPLAYQIFRMGYYAALVPNPAFAKEASAFYWSPGWRYLLDLLQTYWLLVPILGLALLSWLPGQLQRWNRRDRAGVVLAGMPVAGALVYALSITRMGGDFMHGRMLLPAVFALMLPVAVIPMSNKLHLVAALVVIPWAVIAASTLRVPYETGGPEGIVDAHAVSVDETGRPHPITLEDHRRHPSSRGLHARDLSAKDPRLLQPRGGGEIGLAPGVDASVVVQIGAIGIFSYAAGTEVHVVDLFGLGDPIGSRLRLEKRGPGQPGHEKRLAEPWVVARFGHPAARLPPDGPPTEKVAAARQALACDGLERLLEAVRQPLTPERFVRNLFLSFQLNGLRINNDPIRAAQELC